MTRFFEIEQNELTEVSGGIAPAVIVGYVIVGLIFGAGVVKGCSETVKPAPSPSPSPSPSPVRDPHYC
jgi:lactobin A/cerein 7B family class IIb bacteriocin